MAFLSRFSMSAIWVIDTRRKGVLHFKTVSSALQETASIQNDVTLIYMSLILSDSMRFSFVPLVIWD